jgi:hypothetical protein
VLPRRASGGSVGTAETNTREETNDA